MDYRLSMALIVGGIVVAVIAMAVIGAYFLALYPKYNR
jgi:hypothetical protein